MTTEDFLSILTFFLCLWTIMAWLGFRKVLREKKRTNDLLSHISLNASRLADSGEAATRAMSGFYNLWAKRGS